MDFSEALKEIKDGEQVTREGWNGKGMWIAVEFDSDTMTVPYIYIRNVRGDLIPWQPSQEDMFACDWIIK